MKVEKVTALLKKYRLPALVILAGIVLMLLPTGEQSGKTEEAAAGEEGFSLENVLTDTESEERMVEKIALRQAVRALPERERQIIALRYFHGLTQQRTAGILGISKVQVSRVERKALGLLKEKLE